MMARRAIVLLLLAVTVACAPVTSAPVSAPAALRFPEYIFPAIEPAQPPEVLTEHQSAWYLLQGGDTRAAERRFTTLLKNHADLYPAHVGLGYTALSRKDHKAAISHFDRALAINPSYAPALAGKGQTYLAMGSRAEALSAFDAALAADPGLTSIRMTADVLRFQSMQGGVAQARKAAQEGRLAEARTAYLDAIKASPQSPFLYRELAEIERREGNLPAALDHTQHAIALEPGEARSYVLLADVLEAMGQFANAAEALGKASALEPSEELTARIEALNSRAAFDAMPEEYRTIAQDPAITRAQLAALIGVRLDDLVKRAPRRSSALISDIRGNWASPWIIPVTRAGFMEVFLNYTFQPSTTVQRRDLAYAVSRILAFIASENPRIAAPWGNAKPRFPDVPQGNLNYPHAAVAIASGVMQPGENGTFDLIRPVSGAEAVAAVTRLAELAGSRRR
jgi:tetratricopeptide (TPR) repeat protein